MAYAKIANLPPQYGLYSSFIGVMIYPLFGTSKDISIGTTAIMSLMIGQIVTGIMATQEFQTGVWTFHTIAVTLSLLGGFITLGVGILRLGILFSFICQPAVAGFMAGSGLTIVINQLNKIFGIPNINTSEAPYMVFGKTLINLPHAHVDAAFGLLTLIWLYGVRYLCGRLSARYPNRARILFFFNNSRNIIAIVVTTLLSFLINHFGKYDKSPFNILGPVPAGFQEMGVATVDRSLASFVLKDLPGVAVLLVMEHCAISSSLGKTSDYRIDVNQEIMSIGLANILGSFFGAYPSTGAFSRTAVMSKSGSRTPLTSVFVGIIVALAIYAFTPVFPYISTASLAAIIAHAVTDLICGPKVWKRFFDFHPSELVVFAAAYIIALVTRIDVSVYVPVVLSLIVQLYRIARPSYAFLGRLDLEDDFSAQEKNVTFSSDIDKIDSALFFPFTHPTLGQCLRPIGCGIVCFQPQENIVFQNTTFLFDKLADEIKSVTRRGKPLAEKMGDRPWNETTSGQKGKEKPLLRAVILDLSGVHHMDYTGMEGLMDAAVMTERYSGCNVSWYIATGDSISVRQSLLFAGFGRQRRRSPPGSFFSDLSKAKNGSGHPPGEKGCRTGQDKTYDTSKKRQQEQVVVIEDVEHQRSTEKPAEDAKSVDEIGSMSNASFSSDDSSDWCYCDDQKLEAEAGPIGTVRDRYPYFFTSLHEAVRTALINHSCEDDTLSNPSSHHDGP
ncbi:hypothetical protein DFQ28_000933 [Apophysomyces sp. BC1034]|nr:hypothetical protein DFQ30_008783 [Apophysomyces sp. BC1015]KAG0183343.1 hypothetical protein DFQ29_006912 [Apophysomyces sp. BC1021]KAG0194214.1 hypothetical protein DFQ28_000933 [Apophysomyces sp. BC1034]